MKGHRHKSERRRGEPWPRKYVPKHTEGKCPHCGKHVDNIEEHVKAKHKNEKPLPIKGKVHGHDS